MKRTKELWFFFSEMIRSFKIEDATRNKTQKKMKLKKLKTGKESKTSFFVSKSWKRRFFNFFLWLEDRRRKQSIVTLEYELRTAHLCLIQLLLLKLGPVEFFSTRLKIRQIVFFPQTCQGKFLIKKFRTVSTPHCVERRTLGRKSTTAVQAVHRNWSGTIWPNYHLIEWWS